MLQYTRYFGQFNDFRGNLTGLPSWARFIVGLVAIPGVVLLGLSILAVVVSLLALLLLTVPVYSVLRSITASGSAGEGQFGSGGSFFRPAGRAKRVEVTVLNPGDRPV